MPLKACVPPGRTTFYLRGTVKAGKRSRSVYESTGIGAGEPGARERAEEIRLRREGEIYHELLHGPQAVVTFTEAAAGYGDKRARERVARNPALAGRPDKEMEYVAKWVRFLRARGVADIPLEEFCASGTEHLDAYFAELHIAKKHKLSTMHRERDTYQAVMNFAVSKKWAPADYPMPELPEWDIARQPVNKWLYPEEIRLFILLAPKHLRLYVAGVFATGNRGGELIFISRRFPNYDDRNGTGLCLDPGFEHVYLGWTKNGEPLIKPLPDWWVEMIKVSLAARTDSHDALFLTDDGVPYKRPRRQRGFIVKTAWLALRRRVAAVVYRLAKQKARQAECLLAANPRSQEAVKLRLEAERLTGRAGQCLRVTPHWGRHNAASHVLKHGGSKLDAKRVGGWRSDRMLERYTHLSPEAGKALANQLDFRRPVRAEIVQIEKKKA